MMIFYHIEQVILKIMIFIGIGLLVAFGTTYIVGLYNVKEYKGAIALITLVLFILYLIPGRKKKFGENPHFYKEVAKMSPELAEQHKITSIAILKTVYRPGLAIPRIILLLIQLALIIFMLKMVFTSLLK